MLLLLSLLFSAFSTATEIIAPGMVVVVFVNMFNVVTHIGVVIVVVVVAAVVVVSCVNMFSAFIIIVCMYCVMIC